MKTEHFKSACRCPDKRQRHALSSCPCLRPRHGRRQLQPELPGRTRSPMSSTPMGTAVAIPAASLFLPASSARLNHLQHSSIKPLKGISAPLWKARTTAVGSTVPEGGCRPQHAAACLHGGSAFWGEGTGPNSPMRSACGGGTASPSKEASRKLSRSPARSLPCFVPVSFLHFNHEPFCPGFLTHGLGGNRGTAALTLRLA